MKSIPISWGLKFFLWAILYDLGGSGASGRRLGREGPIVRGNPHKGVRHDTGMSTSIPMNFAFLVDRTLLNSIFAVVMSALGVYVSPL